ncbi:hypothetical protein B0H13DRAFT_1860929 [Mycena leptocephala]|nr:hypothetical protein B0H13DRAFT_1860929 [Mycena leptocephala]
MHQRQDRVSPACTCNGSVVLQGGQSCELLQKKQGCAAASSEDRRDSEAMTPSWQEQLNMGILRGEAAMGVWATRKNRRRRCVLRRCCKLSHRKVDAVGGTAGRGGGISASRNEAGNVGSRLQVLLTRFDDAMHPSVQVERRRSNLAITHVGDRKRKTVGSTSTDASAAHTPASAHRGRGGIVLETAEMGGDMSGGGVRNVQAECSESGEDIATCRVWVLSAFADELNPDRRYDSTVIVSVGFCLTQMWAR